MVSDALGTNASDRSVSARKFSSMLVRSLNAEAATPSSRHASNASSTTSSSANRGNHISQEEIQRRMEILMGSPKLWQEFKQTLENSDNKSPLATQIALRDFLENNPEFASLEIKARGEKSSSSRMSHLLGAFSSLSTELGAEEATPTPARAGKSRMPAAGHNSGLGRHLLREARKAATASMAGMDQEVEASIEETSAVSTGSRNVQSRREMMPPSKNVGSARDIMGALNELFSASATSIQSELLIEDDEGE